MVSQIETSIYQICCGRLVSVIGLTGDQPHKHAALPVFLADQVTVHALMSILLHNVQAE